MVWSVKEGCLELERPKFVSVDEISIPFRSSQLFTSTPRKPNPHGIKVFFSFDFACGNPWLECRRYCRLKSIPVMDSMVFKLKVAEALIEGD